MDSALVSAAVVSVEVSIPRSGFCWFGLIPWIENPSLVGWFQSLGRDSVGLDSSGMERAGILSKFQSLGRDSVGLDPDRAKSRNQDMVSFNPSVGILLVWTYLDGDYRMPP